MLLNNWGFRGRSWLSQPVSRASLDWFRTGFGLLLAWYFVEAIFTGILELQYIRPKFFFSYPGFDWVSPWPGQGMVWHYGILALLALLVALGICYRLASILLFAGFAYVFLLDMARYQNHLYLTLLLCGLLVVLPRPQAIWEYRKSSANPPAIHRWCLWLLRFQVGLVYFFGGIAKLNTDWLLRAEPMHTWLTRDATQLVSGTWFAEPWTAYFLSWGGALFDLGIVPALCWRRTRPWALGLVAMFHLANAFLYHIGFFPWLMLWASLLFLEPDWPHVFISRLKRLFKKTPAPASRNLAYQNEPSILGGVAWLCLMFYCLIQVAVPLRHWVYPGDVNWTEEGHRFAWRMKLREKVGDIQFFWVQKDREEISRLNPETLLDERQISKMTHDPHLIRAFCRAIADGLRRKGQTAIDIRVISKVSLNGRPFQPLVDPTTNIVDTPPGLGFGTWILALRPLVREPATDEKLSDR